MTDRNERTIDLGVFYMEPPALAPEQLPNACVTLGILRLTLVVLSVTETLDRVQMEDNFQSYAKQLGITYPTYIQPVAVALTSHSEVPDLYARMIEMGRDKCIVLIENAYHALRRSMQKSVALYPDQIDLRVTLFVDSVLAL